MNLPLEAAFLIMDNHAAPAGTQMGVIVHAEKDVENAVPLGDRSKKTAQNVILLICYAVQGILRLPLLPGSAAQAGESGCRK